MSNATTNEATRAADLLTPFILDEIRSGRAADVRAALPAAVKAYHAAADRWAAQVARPEVMSALLTAVYAAAR